MNGPHDLGGRDGFGPILHEANEPVFHAEWERRMFAIAAALPFSVPFADDHLRREIERIPPAEYLRSSYYELWLRSITSILRERNVVSCADLDAPETVTPRTLCPAAIRPDAVAAAVSAGASTRAATAEIPKALAVGDRVMVRNNHPYHHTRVPQYIRGRKGRVIMDHGVFSFPDTNSQDRGECPQHCYTVEFEASEVWGDQADQTETVMLDLWESYLQRLEFPKGYAPGQCERETPKDG